MGQIVDQLIKAGYSGYAGWGDNEAAADFNAGHGAGKMPSGGGSSGGGGRSIPAFSFDYAQAAKDAYGELGPYYTNLLTQSKGDINLALSRLIEDYARGVRDKTQAAQAAQSSQDITQNSVLRRTVNDANRRGLYTRSLDDPTNPTPAGPVVTTGAQPKTGGFGIPDQNINDVDTVYGNRTANRNTALGNFVNLYGPTGVKSQRAQVNATTKIQRKTESLDQSRKLEAGNMANTRGQQAYQKYLATYGGAG